MVIVFAEFGQNTAGRFRMNESYLHSVRTTPWFGVDEPYAGPGQPGKFGFYVGNPVRHVMQALTALFQKTGDRAFRACRLKQFDMNAADIEKNNPDLLIRHFLWVAGRNPQYRRKCLGRGLEVCYGHPDVIDFFSHPRTSSKNRETSVPIGVKPLQEFPRDRDRVGPGPPFDQPGRIRVQEPLEPGVSHIMDSQIDKP